MEERVFRNYYNKHMDKTKGKGGSKRGRRFGWGGRDHGEKMQITN